MEEKKHLNDNKSSLSERIKECMESLDSELPSYDVVWVNASYRVDAIKKLTELVNEKMKQGYIPVGGFFVEHSERPSYYYMYQAMVLVK